MRWHLVGTVGMDSDSENEGDTESDEKDAGKKMLLIGLVNPPTASSYRNMALKLSRHQKEHLRASSCQMTQPMSGIVKNAPESKQSPDDTADELSEDDSQDEKKADDTTAESQQLPDKTLDECSEGGTD